jgi:histidine ammonia-lyase
MIPQYTAASIASQNKQLATPASVDSIVSSNGQETMLVWGKCCQSLCRKFRNYFRDQLLTASQAIEFRRPLLSILLKCF